MSAQYCIALDTHCEFCEMVAVSITGKIVARERCETTIPALVAALEGVRRPRTLTFEEGPLADWLARNLRPHVERLLVCEPRRNALIAKDGDKDDPIDAERLAQLLRGGYLKEVHQAQSLDRTVLKQHVSFYHDRVRERVRQGHQLVAQLRRHGVFASIRDVVDPDERRRLWKQLPPRKILRNDLDLVRQVYELLVEQEEQLRTELVRLARREEPVRRFQELPGFGWIRSITFYVYIDTPAQVPEQVGPVAVLRHWPGAAPQRRRTAPGPADPGRQPTTERCSSRSGQVGSRLRRQPVCRQVRLLDPGGRNPSVHGSAQRRPLVSEHVVELVENRQPVRSHAGPRQRPAVRPHTKLTSPGAGGGVPWVPLSFELQPVNEPTALKSNARSDIRIDLARESPIGAWATFLPTITHPRGEQRTQPRVRNDEPTHRSPPPEGTRTRHATTRRPSPARRCKNGQPPTVRLDSGLPIGGTRRMSMPRLAINCRRPGRTAGRTHRRP